jgi:hypothetical protein
MVCRKVVKQSNSRAKKVGDDIDLKFIKEPGIQKLLDPVVSVDSILKRPSTRSIAPTSDIQR